jgi:hypothetical protein
VLLQVRKAGFGTPMVFNCQMGAGRTTTGTVIGGLLQEHVATMLQSAGSSASIDLTTEQLQTELQGASPKSGEQQPQVDDTSVWRLVAHHVFVSGVSQPDISLLCRLPYSASCQPLAVLGFSQSNPLSSCARTVCWHFS